MKIEDLAKEFKVSADQIKEALTAVGIAQLDVYADEHKKAIAPIFALIAEKKANSVKEAAQQLPKPKDKKDRPMPEIAPQETKDGALAILRSGQMELDRLLEEDPEVANNLLAIAHEKAVETFTANVTGFLDALDGYTIEQAQEDGARWAPAAIAQARTAFMKSPAAQQKIEQIMKDRLKKS